MRSERASAGSCSGRCGSPCRRSPSCSSWSCSRPPSSAPRSRSRTSLPRGSTSSSGSGSRCSPSSSATCGGPSAPGGRSRTRSSGCGNGSGVRPARWPCIRSASGATPEPWRSSPSSRSSSATRIPSNPRALAFAIALYSYVALFGMLAFGRQLLDGAGRGLRDPVRVHSRGSRPSSSARDGSGCGSRSPGLQEPSMFPARSCFSPSPSARWDSTAIAARPRGRTSPRVSRPRTSSIGRVRGSCSSAGSISQVSWSGSRSCSWRFSRPVRSPARP